MNEGSKIKIAAMGDLHLQELSVGTLRGVFEEISQKADILVLSGDLTNLGLPKEAENLATDLAACRIPVVGVLGNHDYESSQVEEVKQILCDAKMIFLADEPFVFKNIGFAGVKGFGGGFERYMLGYFGEPATKSFVNEGINEVLHLENLLDQLTDVEKKVVVLHYSPIIDTIRGEPEVIFPMLGCTRLSEVADRFDVQVIFHGHAHHGQAEGKTLRGIPVFNVSMTVQRQLHESQPYMIYEI